jgi:flagellar hook assembly protein FlgD
VRTVYTGDDETGVYTRFWDGKDDRKRIVSPGTYICQVSVDAEAGEERKAVVINVVY